MNDPLDIGALLARAAGEGQADGVGEFTVSHQQAARKLARFSLPRASAWVSKLIQVAARWQAHSVEVKQTFSETFFHFQLDHIPSEEDIVSAIVSGAIDRGRPLDGLALALRSMVEQAGLAFLLVADDGKTVPRPVYAGAHPGRMSEKARLHPRFHPSPGLSLTVFHRPSHLHRLDPEQMLESLQSHLPIIEEIKRFCFACPFPILGPKGPLEGLLTSAELGFGKNSRLMLLGGLRRLSHSPAQLPLPGDFEDKSPSLTAHPQRLRRSYGGARQAQAAVVASVRLDNYRKGDGRRRSRLLWLNDGVVVQEERLSQLATELLQMNVLANAQGLSTDLTGLSLIDNDEFRLRREEILRAAGQSLLKARAGVDLFADDRDEYSHRDNDAGEALPSLWGGLLEATRGWRESRGARKLLTRQDEVLGALSRDVATVVELLTGDKLPPPPEKRVEFVFRTARR